MGLLNKRRKEQGPLGNFALLPPLSRATEEGGRAPAAALAGGPGRGGGRG